MLKCQQKDDNNEETIEIYFFCLEGIEIDTNITKSIAKL
jgi:hypothetical protein